MTARKKSSSHKKKSTSRKEVSTSGSGQPAKEAGGKKGFVVVGIGASAGGLEPIQTLFKAMPAPCPKIAFVVVSHLDPKHSSIMADLIQKHTSMQVNQIVDGMQIAPDHIYVIPPDRNLEIHDDVFRLKTISPASGPKAPINHFFRSLASHRGETSVAVILSGMGSDGTIGIQKIKSELGMAMVQEPKQAKYAAMPESAIGTGLADYVLPVEEMPAVLNDYVNRLLDSSPRKVEDIPSESLKRVLAILRNRTGNDFSHYKRSTLQRRIIRRMNVHEIDNMSEYLGLLRKNHPENEALVKELLIGVTSFFRDPEAFEALRDKALPGLLSGKPGGYTLRVWVAGCSTGEEAYSLAMFLHEYIEVNQLDVSLQIFATDLDDEAVERARKGFYPGDIAKDVPAKQLNHFFKRNNDGYQVISRIRETIVFARQSIVKDPPFTRLDLISCRNLLIYLETTVQKKLLPLFHHSLKDGGILFLGTSETIGEFANIFTVVNSKWKIFKKKSGSISNFQPMNFPLEPQDYPTAKPPDRKQNDFVRRTEETLLDHHTPPAVVMNHRGDVQYIHGRIGRYFRIPEGTVRNYNAMEMARGGLKIFLISIMRSLNIESKPLVRKIRMEGEDGEFNVQVTIRPLADKDLADLYMVLFDELPQTDSVERQIRDESLPGDVNPKRVRELEDELASTHERLRTMMEEVEASNEELRSANEEYQSTNEELQSANEELNSSKEELQSLNEELETVNSELQAKILQVEQAYDEMTFMLNSLGIPLIFLDQDQRIRRFSEGTDKIIELIESDLGRPLGQLAHKVIGMDMKQETKRVLETGKVMERVIKTMEGHSYFMRIRPCFTPENDKRGVVLFFLDTRGLTEVSQEFKEMKNTFDFISGIVETLREPLLVLDQNLTVLLANESFYRFFHLNEKDVEGKPVYQVGGGQWDSQELHTLLEDVLLRRQNFENHQIEFDIPGRGCLPVLLNGRRILEHGKTMNRILLTMEPKMERRENDEKEQKR